jgi:hypothetical protein
VTPVSPTTNSNQETAKQETDVVDVAQDLENFGIAKSAATRLVQSYPTQYIKEKLAMSQGLVASGSALVSQNPAGWLRCAIEEDYSPPRTYERHQQRSIKEKKDTKLAQAEAKEQYIPKDVSQQARNVFTGKKKPEKPSRENQKIWELVLGKVKEAFPQGGSETRLTETTLIQITDTAARICVSDRFAGAWLERRMYREIRNALKGVLGKDLDLQFVPVS